MEDLQTDTLCDYGKNQNQENNDLDSKQDGDSCAASLVNGCDEIDPLDLMDHCDNESIGSNSDVWKGSDSEDESFDNRDNIVPNVQITDNIRNQTQETSSLTPIDESIKNNKTEESQFIEKTNVDETGTRNCDNLNKEQSGESYRDNYQIEDNTKESMIECENQNEKKTVQNVNSVEEKLPEQTSECEKSEKEKDSDSSLNKEIRDVISDVKKVIEESELGQNSKDIDKTEPAEAQNTEKDEKNGDEAKNEVCLEKEEKFADPTQIFDNSLKYSEVAEDDVTINNAESACIEKTHDDRHARDQEGQDDDVEMDYDADDDFDPSLLCPEVSMDVDDNPVVTTNGGVPNDGERGDSPLLCEPVFSTFVDEVTGAEVQFNLTAEEQELRRRLYGPTNPVQMTRIHCTACNVHLGSALEGQNNRFVHPLLKVLICKECYQFYTSGDFEKDEDGSELYCRWCGQGGQVLCCSKCEFVFCKRCIRTNFGRKKMFEIRDSDNWECFRCNMSQIITQRIACYEFFEYVRSEMSRASTLNNSSEIWGTDHSRCCHKKRSPENPDEVKKPKRKKGDVDPDYNPLSPKAPITVSTTTTTSGSAVIVPASKQVLIPKPIQIVPKYNAIKCKDNDIEFVGQITPPQGTVNTTQRQQFRTILPTNIRPGGQMSTPTVVRITNQSVPPLVSNTNRILNNALQNKNANSSLMKHEWFEKTVRAAARVNSHLSYTLTQLNKAQSQAGSVEELAVVHNKLQEILSSSINSLIQIRKNLRTEFIAGIKTVRLPSKKETFCNDDDVIFVSAPMVMPMPSTSQTKNISKDPLVIIDKSNNNCFKSSNEKPRLKVKSVMELQNVPSECITIPDDTPSPSYDATQKSTENDGDMHPVKEVDPLGDIPTVEIISNPNTASIKPEATEKTVENSVSGERIDNCEQSKSGESPKNTNNSILVYNLENKATIEIRKMMAVRVNVERVDLKDLQKKLAKK